MTTERKLRVAIACDTFWPDVNGASYFTDRLARGLAKKGHAVRVFCQSDTGLARRERRDEYDVHRFRSVSTPFHPTFRVAVPGSLRRHLKSMLESDRPDLVHVQSHFTISRAVVGVARDLQIPVVATNHFMPENLVHHLPVGDRARQRLARAAWRDCERVFRAADRVTVPTQLGAELMTASGVDLRLVPISNGVDLRVFRRSREMQVAARSKFELPDGLTVMFVGRLEPEKALHELLHAVALVRRDRTMYLVMVGAGRESLGLQRLAVSLGIRDTVRFLGRIEDEDVPRVLNAANIFCMPGRTELQSIATLEAMATGMPVVASDAGALPHLVEHGVNGFLYTAGNHEELAAYLARLVDSPDLCETMATAGLKAAQAHDLEHTVAAFEALYLDLVHHGERTPT
jgi:glycosyltransferase involved in cell wall biosynthesis